MNTASPDIDIRQMRYDANKKSAGVAYVLWFFFGLIGAHRFYASKTGSAVVMLCITLVSLLLTVVGIGFIGLAITGIWALIDAFLIPGMIRDFNNRLITMIS